MQNHNLLGLLGIARRAGKLSLGYEAVRRKIRSGGAKAVFMAADLSDGTRRRLERNCAQRVPAVTLPVSISDIGHAVGQKCGCLSVDDAGFAKKALEYYRGK